MVKRKKSLLKSGNSSMGNGMGISMDSVEQHPHPPDYPRKNKTVKRPNLGGGYGSVETAEDWKGDNVLHKEGDGGGGGFSGTVATTADSGYYTPTYGRAATSKKRRKSNAADDTSITVGLGGGPQKVIKAIDALTIHLLKRTLDPVDEPVTVSETDAEPATDTDLEQNNYSRKVEETEETKKDAGSLIKEAPISKNYGFDGRGFDELARGGLKDKKAHDGQKLNDNTGLAYDNENEEEERPDLTDDEVYTLLNKFIASTL